MAQPVIHASTEEHALQMLLSRSSVTFVMHIAVGVLVAFILRDAVPAWRSLIFVAGLSAALVFQFRLARRHGDEKWNLAVFETVRREFDLLAIWVGAMWGFAGFFLFPADDPAGQLFLTFVMGGMSLSAVGTQGMRLRTCYSSIIPGMAPLAVSYASLGSVEGYVSGALISAYLIVLVMLARKINEFMLQAFQLQVEKDVLLKELQDQAVELDLAKSDAEDANLAKSRFLAQASHDLRQPLHAMSLFVEALPDAESEEERDATLQRTRQSLDVLSKLFDSLLDVTLLDTGGIDVTSQVFRPSDLFDEVLSDFGLVAEASDVELRHVRSSCAVRSDPVLLRRVLQNLISNAIRYSEGGRVLVGCRRQGDQIALHVIDNGKGVAAADRDRIFEEFTRLEASRMGAAATPGLGLGLSIVKRVAAALELQVALSSEPLRGSNFSIQGLDRADPAEVVRKPKPAALGVVEGASVFVLDDDPETLAATRGLLSKWGCEVDVSDDPAFLLKSNPDVVICDYEIRPDLTGLDVLDQLDARSAPRPPAIMISGHASQALRRAAMARNVPLIHKPVRPAQLRSALLNALARSD